MSMLPHWVVTAYDYMLCQIEKCVDMLEENVDEHPELIVDLIEAQEYFTFMRKKYRTMVEEGDMFVYAD